MTSTRLLQILMHGLGLLRRWLFGSRTGTGDPVDEGTRRTNASQARFWAEFREGQREADARSQGMRASADASRISRSEPA